MKNQNINIKVAALIIKNGKLLLIKEKNNKNNRYYWNLVKGTFELEKDKNIISAIRREVLEEVNIKIEIDRLFSVHFKNKKNKMIIQFNLLVHTNQTPKLSSKQFQKKLDEDIVDCKFFSKKEIKFFKKTYFMNERAYYSVRDWAYNIEKVLYFFG